LQTQLAHRHQQAAGAGAAVAPQLQVLLWLGPGAVLHPLLHLQLIVLLFLHQTRTALHLAAALHPRMPLRLRLHFVLTLARSVRLDVQLLLLLWALSPPLHLRCHQGLLQLHHAQALQLTRAWQGLGHQGWLR
jgi:hypothetical protein